jgi:hypothetical protein
MMKKMKNRQKMLTKFLIRCKIYENSSKRLPALDCFGSTLRSSLFFD